MKLLQRLTIVVCVIGALGVSSAKARLIRNWSDQELFDQSDLVVIATPTTSADTQERTDLPGLLSQRVIGMETGFAVSAVLKGEKELKNFVLHHYRADEGLVENGPTLIAFKPDEKRKFLLFLKSEADGRYAPTAGQVDPGFQGIAALGNPAGDNSNPPPPADAAKPDANPEDEALTKLTRQLQEAHEAWAKIVTQWEATRKDLAVLQQNNVELSAEQQKQEMHLKEQLRMLEAQSANLKAHLAALEAKAAAMRNNAP